MSDSTPSAARSATPSATPAPFGGFKPLQANFTLAPNQFFDQIVGHYDPCVVSVVALLIRATLGWEDPDSGERRIEADLPLSAFLRPEVSEQSARRGLAAAVKAGFIVQTRKSGPREAARYALRWEDAEAQKRAIKEQRTNQRTPAKAQGMARYNRNPGGKSTHGYVYLIEAASGHIKIGRSCNPDRRAHDFTLQLPFKVKVLHLIEASNHVALETLFHRLFQAFHVNGEWYDLPPEVVDLLVKGGNYSATEWTDEVAAGLKVALEEAARKHETKRGTAGPRTP